MRQKGQHNVIQLRQSIRYVPRPRSRRRLPVWPAFALIGIGAVGLAVVLYYTAQI